MGQVKKVVIIGCNGMAGHVVKAYLESTANYNVWGLARNVETEGNIISLDVSDTDKLEIILNKAKFDVVINCVGVLNKVAEEAPEVAVWYNAYFPQLLAYYGIKYNFKLIHISTDCVFSGMEGSYKEDSFRNGIGFYAQTKALGEVINSKDLTIRTSIVGPELKKDGIGLFHWFMTQNDQIFGYKNAIWSGVTTIELAKGINQAILQDLKGLYQFVNNSKISKYDLLVELNNIFKNGKTEIRPDFDYIVDKSLINTRTDFDYEIPSYKKMILEMREWIVAYNRLYTQYIKMRE